MEQRNLLSYSNKLAALSIGIGVQSVCYSVQCYA